MCLANPARVIEVLGSDENGFKKAKVAYLVGSLENNKLVTSEIGIDLIEMEDDEGRKVKVGDYVIVHVGNALNFLEPEYVSDTMDAFGLNLEEFDEKFC